jgi:succinate dehydrogenase / fumarate reductase, cytochrome b subunit
MSKVRKNRPVNLDIAAMRLPITAITSIIHRATGVLLFVLIPFALYGLDRSLASQAGFDAIKSFMTNPIMKIVIWFSFSGLFYHIIAGVRHLLMDIGVAEEKSSGKIGAWLVIVLAVAASALLAVREWVI